MEDLKDIMKNALTFVWLTAIILFVLAIGPIAIIWSLNTIFPALSITYGFESWLAVVVLCAVFRPNITIKKKD